MAKPAKTNGNGNRLIATDSRLKPADFPLGSVESRAAARALLQTNRRLTAYDQDCLAIYAAMPYIHARVVPDYQVVERTEVYKRGKELRDRIYGPVVPSPLDPEYNRRTMAGIVFEGVRGRSPEPGDTMRYEDVAESRRAYHGALVGYLSEHGRGNCRISPAH